MKQTVKLNESQLRQIVAESVKKVLEEENMLGAAMRNAYNSGRYDTEDDYTNLKDIGKFIKGDKDDADAEFYKFWKDAYKQDKEKFKKTPIANPSAKNGIGGFANWPNKEKARYSMGEDGINAIGAIPGLKGKVARAATVPAVVGANLAGKIAKRFTSESIKLNESQLRQIVAECVKKVLMETEEFNAPHS